MKLSSINFMLGSMLISPALIFAQQAPFTIKGKIGKLDAPATVYLKYKSGGIAITDSAALHNGVFILKGKVTEPENATLILQHTPAMPAQAAERKDILWLY